MKVQFKTLIEMDVFLEHMDTYRCENINVFREEQCITYTPIRWFIADNLDDLDSSQERSNKVITLKPKRRWK